MLKAFYPLQKAKLVLLCMVVQRVSNLFTVCGTSAFILQKEDFSNGKKKKDHGR